MSLYDQFKANSNQGSTATGLGGGSSPTPSGGLYQKFKSGDTSLRTPIAAAVDEEEDKGIWGAYAEQVNRKTAAFTSGLVESLGQLARSFQWGSDRVVGGIIGERIDTTESPMLDFDQKTKEWGEVLRGAGGLTPENMTFTEKVFQGGGSAATFFVPGLGIARGTSVLATVSPRVAMLFGGSASAALEAMAEAGETYDQVKADRGLNSAVEESTKVFYANAILLAATNYLGAFNPAKRSALKAALLSAPVEGLQEATQQLIQNEATGRPLWEGVLESGAIGSIIGGVMGGAANVTTDAGGGAPSGGGLFGAFSRARVRKPSGDTPERPVGDMSVQSRATRLRFAILDEESGGDYSAKGASGEGGGYQFMPDTWRGWAQKWLGDPNAPQTPKNQDVVAQKQIEEWIRQGKTDREIALMWNGGEPIEKKGVNSFGVKYDSGAYADRVIARLGTEGGRYAERTAAEYQRELEEITRQEGSNFSETEGEQTRQEGGLSIPTPKLSQPEIDTLKSRLSVVKKEQEETAKDDPKQEELAREVDEIQKKLDDNALDTEAAPESVEVQEKAEKVFTFEGGGNFDKKELKAAGFGVEAMGFGESADIDTINGEPAVAFRWDDGALSGFSVAKKFRNQGVATQWLTELLDQSGGKFEVADANDAMLAVLNRVGKVSRPDGRGVVTVTKKTQRERVIEATKEGAKSIKEVAAETGILEPNVRRILGVGEKEGTFERVEKGVYVFKKDGKDFAFVETGNAVESLPRLAAEGFKADMIFLDIPYDTAAVKGGNRGVKYDLLSVEQFKTVVNAVSQIARNADTPVLHMFSQAASGMKDMERYNQVLLDAGFKPIARGEYQKLFKDGRPVTNPRGEIAKPEGILLLTKSGKFDKESVSLDFAFVRPKGYQTEKPEEMMKALIEMTTDEGELVLDPFAGSGVTGAAATKTGRKSYSIEKSPEVVEKITIPRVRKALDEQVKIESYEDAVRALTKIYPKGVKAYHQTSKKNKEGIEKTGFKGDRNEEVYFTLETFDKSRNTNAANEEVIEVTILPKDYEQIGVDEGSYSGKSNLEKIASMIESGTKGADITLTADFANQLLKESGTSGKPATAEEAAETYWDEVLQKNIEAGKAVVIGADDLKDYFGNDYDRERHPIYSKAANILFKRAVNESSDSVVKFSVGGTGSGKSDFIIPDVSDEFSGVIYDSTGWDYQGMADQIAYVESKGKEAQVYGVVPDVRRARAYTFLREKRGEHPVTEAAFVRTHSGAIETMLKLIKDGKSVYVLDTRGIFSKEQVETAEYESSPVELLEKVRYSEDNVKDLIKGVSAENAEEVIAERQGGSSGVPEEDGSDQEVDSGFTVARAKESLKETGRLPEVDTVETKFYAMSGQHRWGGVTYPPQYVEVKGKLVDIDGHDYFLHRPYLIEGTKVTPTDKGWVISEAYTGLRLHSTDFKTQKAAIEAARKTVADTKKTGVLDEAILRGIKNFGLSPRYMEKPKSYPSGAKGASIGEYRGGTPFKVNEIAAPVQFPEMVRLAAELMNDYPKVVEKFRKEGKRGDFLPMGDGRIRLAATLFERENVRQLGATLAHEIGHLVDYLPEKTMARGNLLGRLLVLKGFRKDFITSETMRTNAELREQMYALSKYWRPFDERTATEDFLKYRKSAEEIYADFISALFNDPFKTQDIAPAAYNLFFAAIDRKPAVKEAYFELQELLRDRNAVLKGRRESVSEMFEKGEQTAAERQKEWLDEQEARKKSIWFQFKYEFVDKNEEFRELVKKAKKEGRTPNDDDNPVFYLEEYNYLGGKLKTEVESRFNSIYTDLQKEGLTWEELGEVMFYERVLLGDRGEVANPLGLQPEFVQDLYDDLGQIKEGQNEQHRQGLADMRSTLGNEKFEFLKKKADEYRRNLKAIFEEGHREGLYGDSLKEMIETNDFYVPFRPIKYAGQRQTFSVKKQKGSLQPIENPANTGIKKAIAIIRAIERNKVKRASIKFLQKEAPEVLEDPKTVFDGKRQVFVEPSPNAPVSLITYMEGGKVEGFYVNDPYIAKALELHTIENMNRLLAGLRFSNNTFFRPLFITFNLGFQSFNLVRDFWRFWKNVPNMTLFRAANLYRKSVRAAKVRGFGLPANPTEKDLEAARLIESMEADQIISITFNDILKGEDIEAREIDRIMQGVGAQEANPRRWATKPVLKQVYQILDFIENLGNAIETLPKVAGKYELEGKMPPREMRSFIRRYVGSPDFLAGGVAKKWSNEVFLFSNAIFQGIRADAEIATNPNSRMGWWWKTTTVNLVPKMLLAAALYGLLGDDLKELLEGVSEYDKTNYIIIPFGRDENGKTMYVRVPQDETGRFVSGIFWKMLRLAENPDETLKTLSQVASYTGGQLPSVSPVIETISATSLFIAGQNPYDAFRGRQILTDDQQQAGGMERFKPFAFWVFEQLGGGIFVKLYSETSYMPREETVGEKIITAPAIGNVIGRWVKISDFGRTEELRKVRDEVRTEKARERLDERSTLWEYIREAQGKSPAEIRQIEKDMIREIVGVPNTSEKQDKARQLEKRFRTLRIRGSADARVDMIITAQSNDERAELLVAYEEGMTAADFDDLKRFLLRERLITPDVLRKFTALKSSE